MATAASTSLPQSHVLHIFDQLGSALQRACEVCHEPRAVFLWTQQRDGKMLHEQQLAVCRVCAGMILLIGKE
jgi:hypothetical protein